MGEGPGSAAAAAAASVRLLSQCDTGSVCQRDDALQVQAALGPVLLQHQPQRRLRDAAAWRRRGELVSAKVLAHACGSITQLR